MIPTFETARLRLRAPRPSDLDAIFRLGNNPNVMRYITNGVTQSRQEAKADLEKRIRSSQGKMGYWIVELKSTREIIGWAALKQLDNTEEIEIGYRLLEEFWGRGYATESTRRLLAYGFLELKLERIVSIAMETNRASTRVMEKTGLKFEKRGIFYETKCVYYAIDRKTYLEQNSTTEPTN